MSSADEIKNAVQEGIQAGLKAFQQAQGQVQELKDTTGSLKGIAESSWKTWLSGWQGKALILITGLAISTGIATVTASYWVPYTRSLLANELSTGSLTAMLITPVQNAWTNLINKWNINPIDACYQVIWWLSPYVITPLIVLGKLGYFGKKAGGAVKNVVNQATENKETKQLRDQVSTLTEEKLSVAREKQIVDGQIKEAKATITVLEQELDQTKNAKNQAISELDKIWDHAGMAETLTHLGFKRYTEK